MMSLSPLDKALFRVGYVVNHTAMIFLFDATGRFMSAIDQHDPHERDPREHDPRENDPRESVLPKIRRLLKR